MAQNLNYKLENGKGRHGSKSRNNTNNHNHIGSVKWIDLHVHGCSSCRMSFSVLCVCSFGIAHKHTPAHTITVEQICTAHTMAQSRRWARLGAVRCFSFRCSISIVSSSFLKSWDRNGLTFAAVAQCCCSLNFNHRRSSRAIESVWYFHIPKWFQWPLHQMRDMFYMPF